MNKVAAYEAILLTHPLWAEESAGQTKIAARRYLKDLRALVEAGDISGATRLAEKLDAEGSLKKTRMGSIIKVLGSGAEGPAALVVGSTDSPVPLSVMKTFDTKGPLYDQRVLAEKFNMLRRARATKDPTFATLYSPKLRRADSGTPYYHTEFVSGPEKDFASYVTPEQLNAPGSTDFTRAVAHLPASNFRMGAKKTLGDVVGNPGNTIMTASGPKIIDFIPSSPDRAAQTLAASSPRSRFVQRWVGLPVGSTAPDIETLMQRQSGFMQRLMEDSAFRRKAILTTPITQSEMFRTLYGIQNVAPSDFTLLEGVRRADRSRALRGLTPQKPRKEQIPE
jgi:hypothetical protein